MLDEVLRLEQLVATEGACALPGCTIKYDSFVRILRRAMSRGYVRDHFGNYIAHGLWHGFDLGFVQGSLPGIRAFRNYKSSLEHREETSAMIYGRVEANRTIVLGAWKDVKAELQALGRDACVFPMGAVPKPQDPSTFRATDDHTRTGFNAHTILGILGHSLDTFKKVCYLFSRGAFMYVSDVQDAFMLLPLSPAIWMFMLFRWFKDGSSVIDDTVFLHLFGDFGTRGMPGTFKIFLVDCIVNMARSEFVLTLPLEIYVDDAALIGDHKAQVDSEMASLQVFTHEYCGVTWKMPKDRPGSQTPLYIGFNWDSTVFTLALEERKLLSYLDVLERAARSRTLSLHERQSLAGKMERGIRTLPPGAACLLVHCYSLMRGLTLPWHLRRTTKGERSDYLFVHDLLELNLGKGYYRYDDFSTAPCMLSDAMTCRGRSGGGWVSACGMYDHFTYGASASKKCIDELEGDVVLRACADMCGRWHKKMVPFGIDNMAFQRSSVKGRSGAPRLNVLLRGLFVLQVKYTFILDSFWLSTHANFLADDLSRGRIDHFFARVHSFLRPGSVLFARPGAGRVVTFADNPWRDAALSLRAFVEQHKSDEPSKAARLRGAGPPVCIERFPREILLVPGTAPRLRPGPRCIGHSPGTAALSAHHWETAVFVLLPGFVMRDAGIWVTVAPRLRGGGGPGTRRAGSQTQRDSVQYPRCSIFDGLPIEHVQRVEDMMDNRLAPSSMSRVMTSLRKWDDYCESRGWPTLMKTGLPSRGGRLASWVTSMVDDTQLVYNSISTYVWGVCTWHTLQHVADPTLGVDDWHEFMMSVAVLTAVPSEPRRPIPMEVTRSMLQDTDWDDFCDVQFSLLALVSVFCFNRTETPCPKNFTGPHSFDPQFHWQVGDFRLRKGARGVWVLWVRFKGFKQDRRMERPSASHAPDFVPFDVNTGRESKDWVPIGDVPDDPDFSIARAYMRFVQLVGRQREDSEPLFLARDKARPYTYRCLLDDLHTRLERVGADTSLKPHGWRVEGYNRSKDGNGLEITVAHGGWQSDAHDRYERFASEAVLSIPARMLGVRSPFVSEDGRREIRRTRVARGSRADPSPDTVDDASGVEEDDDVPDRVEAGPPPGFEREDRVTPSGRGYVVWRAPDGRACQSRPAAWMYYQSLREDVDDGDGILESPVGASSTSNRGSPSREPEVAPEAVSRDDVGGPSRGEALEPPPESPSGAIDSVSGAPPRRPLTARRPRPSQSRVTLEELATFTVESDRPPARPHPLERARSSRH